MIFFAFSRSTKNITETQVVNQKMKEVLEENKEGEEVVCERVAVRKIKKNYPKNLSSKCNPYLLEISFLSVLKTKPFL